MWGGMEGLYLQEEEGGREEGEEEWGGVRCRGGWGEGGGGVGREGGREGWFRWW